MGWGDAASMLACLNNLLGHASMPKTALCAHCQGHDSPLDTWPKPWTLACTNNLLWAWCMRRPVCMWLRSWQLTGIIHFFFYIYTFQLIKIAFDIDLKKLVFFYYSAYFCFYSAYFSYYLWALLHFFSIILESHYTILNIF